MVRPDVRELLASERTLLVEITEHLARAGAPESDSREAKTALRSLEEAFLLVVVGEFNAGKSSFLNTILGSDLLAEGVTPTTDHISILVHGSNEGEHAYAFDTGVSRTELSVDEFVMRRELPFEFLDGVALVDTPGTNAVIRRHQALTEGFLPRADLVLFLSSADRPFAESERVFLELAKTWGRKVWMIVNKADLLENAAELEEVRDFVARNAREVLGLEPPIYLVSVRRERKKRRSGEGMGDAGFQKLERDLRSVLGELEKVRLKLLSPLGVSSTLLERSKKRSQTELKLIEGDTKTLLDLEKHLDMHSRDLKRDLDAHLTAMDAILDGIVKRGNDYIDNTMRFTKIPALLNTDAVRAGFEREVVAEAPIQLERRVSEVIDSFVERNLNFWDFVVKFLSERDRLAGREGLSLGTRFKYDRQSLLESLGQAAGAEIDGLDRQTLSNRLAGDAQSAVLQSGLTGGVGIGLGAALALVVGGLAADFTGIGIGLGAIGLGFFVLPRRRQQAKAQLTERVEATRQRLRQSLGHEYNLEVERASARLRDASGPYTRFIRAESERLGESVRSAIKLGDSTNQLRGEVERLG
jgi:small GTP-binding protein